jgi:glutathione S-transferase
MVDEPTDSGGAASAGHVVVFGGDHSPWVQSVLLGLHERGIAHTVITAPPLPVLLNSGILMPAARIDDGPWLLDSGRILRVLGFSKVSPEDHRALMQAFGGALQRVDNSWEFWFRWSLLRDEHPAPVRRLWNHFWRAFSVFYFYALILFARRMRSPHTREQQVEAFSYWERRLAEGGPFLSGDAPDTVDLQLFGMVQMYASIPGQSLALLREDRGLPRLRQWIENMQRHFSSYTHLYTAQDFEPNLPAIERSPATERPAYWLGCALMWIAFPITLLTTVYFARRVRKEGLVSN